MHGLLHLVLKETVVGQFGLENWEAVLGRLGLTDDAAILQVDKQYDDATTLAAIEATCCVLGVSLDDALRVTGAQFIRFAAHNGHVPMLLAMGDSLETFLTNLDHMHENLERSFLGSSFPVFSIGHRGSCRPGLQPGADGSSFDLFYTSTRGGACS